MNLENEAAYLFITAILKELLEQGSSQKPSSGRSIGTMPRYTTLLPLMSSDVGNR